MTPELTDDRLREALGRIAEWGTPDAVPPLPEGDTRPALTVLGTRPQRGRRVWWAAAAAFVAVVVAVVATVDQVEQLPIADGVWTPMADAPIPPRANPAAVWTGSEVIVVGGEAAGATVRRDAAAYNPVTNSWRELPSAPADVFPGATALWTGTRVVIVQTENLAIAERPDGGSSYQLPPPMTLDPATGQWTRLPDAAYAHAATDVDGRVIELREGPAGTAEVVELDPITGETSVVATSPRRGLDFDFVRRWRGIGSAGRAIFVSSDWMPINLAPDVPVGFVVDLASSTIDEIPQPPTGGARRRPAFVFAEPTLVARSVLITSGLVMVGNGDIEQAAARYDLVSRQWRLAEPMPKVPMDEAIFKSTRFTTAAGAIVATGGYKPRGVISEVDGGGLRIAYDPERDRWVELPEPEIDLHRVGHVAVWTGRSLVVWSGLRDTRGSVNRPDTPAAGGAVYRIAN